MANKEWEVTIPVKVYIKKTIFARSRPDAVWFAEDDVEFRVDERQIKHELVDRVSSPLTDEMEIEEIIRDDF